MGIKLNYQDSNFDIQTELVEKYLNGVSDKLKNNPSFVKQLYSAVHFLTTKLKSEDYIPNIELSISEDGKSFSLIGGVRPSPYCQNPNFQNNKCFEKVEFSLEGKDDDMTITTYSGTFFNFADYRKEYNDEEMKQKFGNCQERDTPTVISVYHTQNMFTKDGIEVSRSSYSDDYPLSVSMQDENALKVQTMVHSPTKWYFNLIPEPARFEFNPTRRNAHRFLHGLGIVQVLNRTGLDRDYSIRTEAADYVAGTEYPELLSTSPAPFRTYEGNGAVITPQYEQYYPGMSSKELEKELEKIFAAGLDTSKTRDSNPEAYNALKAITSKWLEKKYGNSLEAEQQAPKLGM